MDISIITSLVMTNISMQADIELVSSNKLSVKKYQNLCQLESYIRKNVLSFRQNNFRLSIEELIDFLKSSASKFGFNNPDITFYRHYIDHNIHLSRTVFRFTFGKLNGIIYITSF